MAGIIDRLTEGVVNRDMRAEGHALLTKWERTGLLEGLNNDSKKNAMARLLENQAKELLRESSAMASGDVEGFAAVAFPIVRRVFAGLIANDLVSVQPMSLPSGLIFFLDFTFSGDVGGSGNTQEQRGGNKQNESIFGTNRVGSQITGGVGLVGGTYGEDLSGPRSVMGYAYSSATGSSANCANGATTSRVVGVIKLDGVKNMTENQKALLDYDPDLLSQAGSNYAIVLDMADDDTNGVFSQADYENMGAFAITDVIQQDDTTGFAADLNAGALTVTAISNIRQVRRLSKRVSSDSRGAPFQSGLTSQARALRLVLVSDETQTETLTPFAVGAALPANTVNFPIDDNFNSPTALGAVRGASEWALEGSDAIPEIDIKVDSIAVTAQTKKLKAKWTPELGQDLNAYHNLDAEVELTSILSEQIALEIDREILADLVRGATASTRYWSRAPGLFVDANGSELGASSAAPDFTGTVSEWYETLVETINDVSAAIHRKTLRGGANFVVCGPEVANILEFTAGFRASVTHDDENGSIGAVSVGSLSKKFDVIVDPYFLRNVVLVGRRGSSFLESGYVYAPYVPLQTTPTIFGPEDFVPRKGVMTRYAKKMVRPDMYGIVIVRGLLGEQGTS